MCQHKVLASVSSRPSGAPRQPPPRGAYLRAVLHRKPNGRRAKWRRDRRRRFVDAQLERRGVQLCSTARRWQAVQVPPSRDQAQRSGPAQRQQRPRRDENDEGQRRCRRRKRAARRRRRGHQGPHWALLACCVGVACSPVRARAHARTTQVQLPAGASAQQALCAPRVRPSAQRAWGVPRRGTYLPPPRATSTTADDDDDAVSVRSRRGTLPPPTHTMAVRMSVISRAARAARSAMRAPARAPRGAGARAHAR